MEFGKYINLFTDYGFKIIFGQEPNKELLISFLNSLFRGKEVIKDLQYHNSEQQGNNPKDRKAIYDLYCSNEKEKIHH